jgi:hypothetical protein
MYGLRIEPLLAICVHHNLARKENADGESSGSIVGW